MKYSPPLREFKRRFGQSNHFLITTLVGLDAVKDGEVAKKDEFSTSWNPVDVQQSAIRSRGFVLGLFMNSTADSLSYYFDRLDMSDLLSPDAKKVYNKKSIKNSVADVGNYYSVDRLTIAMSILAISVRNTFIHHNAKLNIGNKWKSVLNNNIDKIKNDFCGLDVSNFVKKSTVENVTFKEVASFIKATHMYVYELDKRIIENIDIFYYCSRQFDKMMISESFKCKINNNHFKKKLNLIKNTFINNGVVIDDEIASKLLSEK